MPKRRDDPADRPDSRRTLADDGWELSRAYRQRTGRTRGQMQADIKKGILEVHYVGPPPKAPGRRRSGMIVREIDAQTGRPLSGKHPVKR